MRIITPILVALALVSGTAAVAQTTAQQQAHRTRLAQQNAIAAHNKQKHAARETAFAAHDVAHRQRLAAAATAKQKRVVSRTAHTVSATRK